MSNSIYESIILSKSNIQVPLFKSGRSVDSRYFPEKEAEKIIAEISNSYKIFLVFGIGSGILIQKLYKKFPDAKILAMEKNKSDLEFLEQLKLIHELKQNSNCLFFSSENLIQVLLTSYIPSVHGDLRIIEQRAWIQENKEDILQIKNDLSLALKKISADFSVQSYFGKIWQHNIFSNLKLFSQNKNDFSDIKIPLDKTAVIVAAGPSLDKTINEILNNRNLYYVISTDTSISVLLNNGIIPDAILSIDGQLVSSTHFLLKNKNLLKNMIFIFDLCANSSAVKKVYEISKKVLFSVSAHPLCKYIKSFFPSSFISLQTGSGTVTIAALDFAIKAGFQNIQIFGADFSYTNGKPYTKGTYLDKEFGKIQNKINSSEKKFVSLMFRTELKKISQKKYTTEVLESYKLSMEEYLINEKSTFNLENDIYFVKNTNSQTIKFENIENNVNFDFFMKNLLDKKLFSEQELLIFLPYIAWLRKNTNINDFDKLQKLALSSIVRYNNKV